MEQHTLALWLIERHAAMDVGSLQRWVHELGPFGQAHAVRAAIVAARAALPAWERAEPVERAPHDRIAAAEAWLACPCRAHAEAAGDLAFANGDDNPLKGWSAIRIDGREIDDIKATYAHWSADSACSAAYYDFDQAGSADTVFAQAVEALDDGATPPIERARTIADAIADALAPFAADRAAGAPPMPSSVPTTFAYAGPALSNVSRFASHARRVLAVLGADVDAVPALITHDFPGGARVDRYRFASADGSVEIRVAPGPRWSASIERTNGARVVIDADGASGEGGTVEVIADEAEAARVARALHTLT